jgi:hypothetical protein
MKAVGQPTVDLLFVDNCCEMYDAAVEGFPSLAAPLPPFPAYMDSLEIDTAISIPCSLPELTPPVSPSHVRTANLLPGYVNSIKKEIFEKSCSVSIKEFLDLLGNRT